MSGRIRIPAESLAVLEDMYADAKACRSPDAEGSPPAPATWTGPQGTWR